MVACTARRHRAIFGLSSWSVHLRFETLACLSELSHRVEIGPNAYL